VKAALNLLVTSAGPDVAEVTNVIHLKRSFELGNSQVTFDLDDSEQTSAFLFRPRQVDSSINLSVESPRMPASTVDEDFNDDVSPFLDLNPKTAFKVCSNTNIGWLHCRH
jgi:hypothetical protein